MPQLSAGQPVGSRADDFVLALERVQEDDERGGAGVRGRLPGQRVGQLLAYLFLVADVQGWPGQSRPPLRSTSRWMSSSVMSRRQ